MRRLLLLVAVAAIVCAASGCSSLGARAFKVGSVEVSQRTLDGELAVLHDNSVVAQSFTKRRLAAFGNGSIPSDVTTNWISNRIYEVLAQNVLSRFNGHVTAGDRVAVGFPKTGPYAQVPKSFRQTLVQIVATVNAAARALAAHDASVLARAPTVCPSLRYVSHLLVKTRAEVAAIKRLLDQGEDFVKLTKANSIDTSSNAQGGYLGCLDDLGSLDPAFVAVARAQPLHVVSDPVQTTSGFSLILVTDAPGPSDLRALALAVLQDKARHADVSVDPRYGRWDPTRGVVLPPKPSG